MTYIVSFHVYTVFTPALVMFFVRMYLRSRGPQRHAVVVVNDPFSDLPVFLVVKNPYDLRSQIRFWILTPKKFTLSRRATVSIT